MKLKNLKTGGVCCCGSCDYDAWQITASQSLVGYGGFVCQEGSYPSDVRYLGYTVSCDAGFTGAWCGGGAQSTKQITVTTLLDPYTGLSCTQGLPPNGYTCGGGTNCDENCTETSRTYTCRALEKDCAGEGVETIQTRYSLSMPNTQDAVIARAYFLLNSYGVGSLPGPNTSGTVRVGSGGQSVLAWEAFSGEPTASRWTDRGVASLTKSVVKLKRGLRYKIVSYDKYGSKSEQEYDGVKDQVITLDPPSSDGSKYFRIPGGFTDSVGYDDEGNEYTHREEWDGEPNPCRNPPTTVEVGSTNQLSTKTLRTDPDGNESGGQPCRSFLIGPDCGQYKRKVTSTIWFGNWTDSLNYKYPKNATNPKETTTTSNASDTNSGKVTFTQIACSGGFGSESGQSSYVSENVARNGDLSKHEVICVNGSTTETYSGTSKGKEIEPIVNVYPGEGTCGVAVSCTLESMAPLQCPQKCGSGSASRPYFFEPMNTTGGETVQCSGDSYSSSYSTSSNTSTGKTYESGVSVEGASNCNQSITTTHVWSGKVQESDFDDDDENQNSSFDTETWTQQGGLCAWKALATDGTMNESTANITIYVSVDGDPEKNYRVDVQMVVESNTTQNNCSFRSYDSYVQTLTVKGGAVGQAGRSLSANTGQTQCMVHSAAVAYEL